MSRGPFVNGRGACGAVGGDDPQRGLVAVLLLVDGHADERDVGPVGGDLRVADPHEPEQVHLRDRPPRAGAEPACCAARTRATASMDMKRASGRRHPTAGAGTYDAREHASHRDAGPRRARGAAGRGLPDPEPRPGEVLVRVRACALNHLDLWTRKGGAGRSPAFPHILGNDIAGEIAALPAPGRGARGRPAGDALARHLLRPLPDVPVRRGQLLPRLPHPRRTRSTAGTRSCVRCPAANVIPIPDAHRLRGGRGLSARLPDRLAHAGDAGAGAPAARTCWCGRRAAAWAWPPSRSRSCSARA